MNEKLNFELTVKWAVAKFEQSSVMVELRSVIKTTLVLL